MRARMSSDFNDIPFFPINYFFKNFCREKRNFYSRKSRAPANIGGYKSIIGHYALFAGKTKTTAPFFTELCNNRLIRRLFNFFTIFFMFFLMRVPRVAVTNFKKQKNERNKPEKDFCCFLLQ